MTLKPIRMKEKWREKLLESRKLRKKPLNLEKMAGNQNPKKID